MIYNLSYYEFTKKCFEKNQMPTNGPCRLSMKHFKKKTHLLSMIATNKLTTLENNAF